MLCLTSCTISLTASQCVVLTGQKLLPGSFSFSFGFWAPSGYWFCAQGSLLVGLDELGGVLGIDV